MVSIRGRQPEHAEAIDELLADVEAAFTGPSFWAPFLERAHAAAIPRLSEWLDTTGRIVAEQFARRGPRSTRPTDMPLSTSPLDAFINPIRASIQPRAYGLKNRERTNRMLMLMQLHADRHDDARAYARHIRERLEANHGRPAIAAALSPMPPASRRCADLPKPTHLRAHPRRQSAPGDALGGGTLAYEAGSVRRSGY